MTSIFFMRYTKDKTMLIIRAVRFLKALRRLQQRKVAVERETREAVDEGVHPVHVDALLDLYHLLHAHGHHRI